MQGHESEEWDAVSASTRESLPSENCDISLRKIPKQLVQIKEVRRDQLKNSVHNFVVENARLKAENGALQERIQFYREMLIKTRTQPSKGIQLSVATVTFLACIVTSSGSSDSSLGSSRHLLSWDESGPSLSRLFFSVLLAVFAFYFADTLLTKSDRKNER